MRIQDLVLDSRRGAADFDGLNQRRVSESRDAQWLVLAFCLLSATFCLRANAQSYTIDWFTIDGGGGTSIGGGFTVDGTVGQPDVGSLSGGTFSLDGGFWSIITAVQTPGPPFLSVELVADGSVRVLWPISTTGYSLEESLAVGPAASWLPVSPPYRTDATHVFITMPLRAGSMFYRLRAP